MINDQLQMELDHYYAYRDKVFTRYTHRLRINCIQQLINQFSVEHQHLVKPKALDVGCNCGIYCLILAEAGYKVTGIDIDSNHIENARKWVAARGLQDRVSFESKDLYSLSEGDTFDLVLCIDVLQNFDNPSLGAEVLYRMLKRGGIAIISMMNTACLFGLLRQAYRRSGLRTLLHRPPLTLDQIKYSRYWFGNIIPMLTGCGFHIEKTYGISYIPFLWTVDGFLSEYCKVYSLGSTIDNLIGRLPALSYLGHHLIVVARKL